MPLSSSGPGLGIFIPATGVRNPLGVFKNETILWSHFYFIKGKAFP